MLDTKLTEKLSSFIKNEVQEIEIYSTEIDEQSKVNHIYNFTFIKIIF